MKKIIACIIILSGLVISGVLFVAFADSTNIQQPLSGMYLTDGFKPVRNNSVSNYSHMSCDYNSSSSQTIYPFAEGTVVKVVTNVTSQDYSGSNARGNYVVIKHTQFSEVPIYSWYQHMKYGSINVKYGDHVGFSTVLGTLGNTGWTLPEGSGYHLHFTITTDENDARLTNDTMLSQYGAKYNLVRGQVYEGDKIVLDDGRIWYNPQRVFATNGEILGNGQSIFKGRTIPDGNYLICCEDNPQYYLDIYGAESPAQDMTIVGVAGPLSSVEEADTCDIWTIKYESDGFYSIKQFRTNKTLSVYSDLVVVPDYGTDTQRWSIVPDGANGYRIQAKFSGQYIDRSNGVYIRTKGDISAQGWVFSLAYGYDRTIPDGNYLISSENNLPYYLDVTGGDLTAQDLTTVGITGPLTSMEDVYSCDIWTVKYESNGFYSIKQYQTDKALTVYPDMVVCQDYGTDTQRWAIIPDGANGYRFQVKAYGTYLDRSSSLYVRSEGSVSDQGWAFTPYPYDHAPTIPDGNYLICCEDNPDYFLDIYGNGYPAEDLTRLCVGGPIIDGEVNDKCTAWTVKYESDGFYSINQYNTSKTLSEYSDLVVFEDYGTVTQRWTIDPDEASGYRIRVKYNRLYLDIESGGANWGSGIQLNSKRDVAAQGWVFIPYNPAPDFNDPDFILPSALTIIDESAFEAITATVVYVPDTCTNIGKWAFRNCLGLTQIRIPASCNIGTDAFEGCNNVMIFGTKGSAAETYANSHSNCTFVAE